MIQKAQGQAIDQNDDHWTVECPNCSKEFEYKGFFDPEDTTECSCGTKFNTEKVWLNNDAYIY